MANLVRVKLFVLQIEKKGKLLEFTEGLRDILFKIIVIMDVIKKEIL
jgi:hypothetical protein